jgi:carbon monoxide dehydrogenase subunit G
MAVVRHEVTVRRPPGAVWARIEDPARIPEWFPGIVAATVEGTTRVVTTRTGVAMPEEIVEHDPQRRRFSYRITAPLFRHHLATIEIDGRDADGTAVVSYTTDAEPRMLALIVGAATRAALEELRRQVEADPEGK